MVGFPEHDCESIGQGLFAWMVLQSQSSSERMENLFDFWDISFTRVSTENPGPLWPEPSPPLTLSGNVL